jgi:adenine-specific DNA-methyltransferase
MASNFEKLQTLLSELFQLDQADLDFGIYRIMNQKRDEITRFLEKELLPQVKTAFAQYQPADKKVLEAELQKAIQGAQALGMDPNLVPKVKELREQTANYSVDTLALENEVYSHLYSFFRRYYESGDFISMRRYKEGVYAIPYEGEEVKLHWANADQYYIKTAEYFRDYTFKLPSGRLAHFKIVEAETERDNVKAADEKDRRFMLARETPVQVLDGEWVMRFEYRADGEKRDQKTLNTLAAETMRANTPAEWMTDLFAPAPTESNPRLTLLEKRLSDYTARNTFDYFIHKDLRGFLRRELDFYIKNEVMHLDDVESETAPRVEQYLSKIKALRSLAHKIIEFLAQIEDFQKKLWLKKKFVVETNYCITLDRVPEELYPEVAANDAQREEWIRLFAIDEIKGGLIAPGYSVPLSAEFLKSNQFLVLDTKYFDGQFSARLVSIIEDLDQNCDGVLINSDNFQALNLIQSTYKERIKCIYIDPPYNTSASEIIYKNNYKHSSWLSLIFDRLSINKSFLGSKSVICVTIDDVEFNVLYQLMKEIYGPDNMLGVVPIRINPSGRPTESGFALTHEYAIFGAKTKDAVIHKMPREEDQLKRYSESDEIGAFEWRNLRREGSNSDRVDGQRQYYPIYANLEKGTIRVPKMEWIEQRREWTILENEKDGETVIWPINDSGQEKNWRWSEENLRKDYSQFVARIPKYGTPQVYYKYRPNMDGYTPFTLWSDTKYSATEHGTKPLKEIFGKTLFSYPKSIHAVHDSLLIMGLKNKHDIVLDYFAGSGTTGHAVISMMREDSIERKYVLVEMGEHFNSVLKPRISKVIYSDSWKDGKPLSRNTGVSHMYKYIRLESYEDTLNNLALRQKREQQLALGQSESFRESYMLSYMLDAESQGSLLNIESFRHPFSYQLNIATGTVGESKPTPIDLVETFNYLVGLRVQTMQTIRGFRVVTGLTPEGERTLIIWRDLDEKDNAALEEFFRKQDYNPRDMEFDLIYVNGDNNLENLRRPDETWKVRLIEEEFLRRMFEEN